jgi:hypothetical protein
LPAHSQRFQLRCMVFPGGPRSSSAARPDGLALGSWQPIHRFQPTPSLSVRSGAENNPNGTDPSVTGAHSLDYIGVAGPHLLRFVPAARRRGIDWRVIDRGRGPAARSRWRPRQERQVQCLRVCPQQLLRHHRQRRERNEINVAAVTLKARRLLFGRPKVPASYPPQPRPKYAHHLFAESQSKRIRTSRLV